MGIARTSLSDGHGFLMDMMKLDENVERLLSLIQGLRLIALKTATSAANVT
jgi:hypothetical protein